MAANPFRIVGGFFGRFFGNTISESAAYGIGGALQEPLRPLLQELANSTWEAGATAGVGRPVGAGTLAEGVAQGQVDHDWAETEAKKSGITPDRFGRMVDIANIGPGVASAFTLYWRGEVLEPGFKRALKRLGLEQEWIDKLWNVRDNVLDPSVIANAVHRGIMRDPTLIVREPPTAAGNVEQVPPSTLDPATEAAGSGLTHERLRVEVGTTGLPPGLIQMLDLLNRGVVTVDDVQRAVSQSNLRNEYMDVVLALRRHLLTPHNYEEAALRGIMSRADADKGAALSGMEPQDAQLLFEIMGRPLTVHQLVTGLARGGVYGGTYADVPEPYRDAIRRSNIRPEYARLAYANRYTYPSAFVLRSLAQAGDLGNTQAVENILLDIGWPPFLAAKVAPRWAPKGAALDPVVKSEQTRLRTATHKSYVAQESDDAAASAALAAAGVDAAVIPEVLALWQHERGLIRAQLSPADVRKAYQQQDLNAATGAAWTRDEAFTALLDRGWGANDANDYLNIPYKG